MVTTAKMLSFEGCIGSYSSTTMGIHAAFLAVVTREAISRHSATRVALIADLLLARALATTLLHRIFTLLIGASIVLIITALSLKILRG